MSRLNLSYGFLIAISVVPLLMFGLNIENPSIRKEVCYSAMISFLAYFATLQLVPVIKEYTSKAGLCGKDLNKKGTPAGDIPIPESLGVASASVFLVCTIVFQVFMLIPESALDEYNAGLTSICFMTLLGFADDVLDLPWRYKIILPAIAALPLLVAYSGSTTILVPVPLQALLGKTLALGVLYKIYMGLLTVFFSQCINIYAGINGLEAGQSLVIACAVLVDNMMHLHGDFPTQHLYSIFLILPFIAVTLALLYYNSFPSAVFVGDTYCYFAGMTFAVVAILAHCSEMIMFFFLPQILNFLYSTPQLFGLVKCPRHRVPVFNKASGKLESSKNLTLLNLTLEVCGPMSEHALCVTLLVLQAACCLLTFVGRHYLMLYLY